MAFGKVSTSTQRSPWRQVNELHLHVTAACNLCCRYCYADASAGRRAQEMPEEIARTAIDEVLDQTIASVIQIIFHGGEPLLRSDDFYDEICTYALEASGKRGIGITFGMQTNLTLLTEARALLLAKYRVKLGTSLDGPQPIHDMYRGAYWDVVRGIEIARCHEIFCGPIVVVHRYNFDHMPEVLENFRTLGIAQVHCNVGAAVGRGAARLQPLSAHEIFTALCGTFEYMLATNFAVIDTKVLMMVEREIFQRHSRDQALLNCSTPFCHAGITLIAVDVDGSVFPCGCASSNAALMPFKIGQIGKASSFDRDRLHQFHMKPHTYETECTICRAQFVCYHGCPAFDATDQKTASSICESNRMFHDYLQARSSDLQSYRTFLIEKGVT